MPAVPAKAKSAAPVVCPLGLYVDELGALGEQLAPHRLAIAREEALRKLIRSGFDTEFAAEAFEVRGAHYVATVGSRGIQRVVDISRLAKLIGLKKLLTIATCTLAALDLHAPGLDVVTSGLTGPRSLKLFRAAPAK